MPGQALGPFADRAEAEAWTEVEAVCRLLAVRETSPSDASPTYAGSLPTGPGCPPTAALCAAQP
jgi:hypothetical protein